MGLVVATKGPLQRGPCCISSATLGRRNGLPRLRLLVWAPRAPDTRPSHQQLSHHPLVSGASRTRRPLPRNATLGGRGEGEGLDETLKGLLSKYAGGAPARPDPSTRPFSAAREAGMGNGVFLMLLLNFALFAGDALLQRGWSSALALDHWAPRWWQFLSAAFVHANWEHLLGNAFSLLVFGRMVEEEEGAVGLWATYLVCGVCGNAASYLSAAHTHTCSLGASSAVFGLCVVGVLAKLRPSPKRLMEAIILGSFVVKQVGNPGGALRPRSLPRCMEPVPAPAPLFLGRPAVGSWHAACLPSLV